MGELNFWITLDIFGTLQLVFVCLPRGIEELEAKSSSFVFGTTSALADVNCISDFS